MVTALLVMTALPALAEKVSIAATVNDQVITSGDVSARRDFIMVTSNIPLTDENKQRITPRVLQMLIDEALQLQEAKRQAITIPDAEVEKAIDGLGERQHLPPGGLKKELAEQGVAVRTLENQIRAQMAWGKVVQRKLRRNVTISQDELVRAQQAEATSPGITEYRFAALLVPITPTSKEEDIKARIDEVQAALASGTAFSALAEKYAGRTDVVFSPPIWAAEEALPPEMQRVLTDATPDAVSPPLRTGNVVQFIQLLEKRATKKSAPSTKVILKQITLDVPANPDKETRTKLADSAKILRDNPGNCEDVTLPTTPVPAKVEFLRLTVGELTPDQSTTLARLNVGEISEPLIAPETLRLVMLCERQEAAATTADLEVIRQRIFEEKIDLEAQKHLRNLRRDATIDIREAE